MIKKRTVRLPARAGAWYLVAGGIAKGMGVICTPFFTRLLGENDYGEFARYMSLLGGASLVLGAFTSGSGIYNGLVAQKNEKGAYLRSHLVVSVGATAAICILLLAFSPSLGIKSILLVPLGMQLICDGATAVMLSGDRFSYGYGRVCALTIVSAVAPPVLSIIWLKLLGGGYGVRIFFLLAVSLVIAVYSLLRLTRDGRNIAPVGRALKESLPLLPQGISSAVSSQADKLILASMLGSSALAKYSVVYSIGVAVQFIVTAVGSSLSPWIIRRLRAREEERVSKLITPMAIGYSALILCVLALAPEGMRILAPGEYLEALPALMPIAITVPLYFISYAAGVGIHFSGRKSYPLIISTAAAIGSLILNYAFVGAIGYLGGGMALMITSLISAVLSVFLLKRSGQGNMISIRDVAGAIAISFPVGWAISTLYDRPILRLCMLVIPAVMLLYSLYLILPQVIEKGGKSRP